MFGPGVGKATGLPQLGVIPLRMRPGGAAKTSCASGRVHPRLGTIHSRLDETEPRDARGAIERVELWYNCATLVPRVNGVYRMPMPAAPSP